MSDYRRMKPGQVLRRLFKEKPSFARLGQQLIQDVCQSFNVSVWESKSAWSNRLGQSTAVRSDDRAAARDPLQRYDTEWLVVARRNNQDLMLPQERCYRRAALSSKKYHPFMQSKTRCQLDKRRLFRPSANNR
jgi:hypothetical protein